VLLTKYYLDDKITGVNMGGARGSFACLEVMGHAFADLAGKLEERDHLEHISINRKYYKIDLN
jgi:hypothetical protein